MRQRTLPLHMYIQRSRPHGHSARHHSPQAWHIMAVVTSPSVWSRLARSRRMVTAHGHGHGARSRHAAQVMSHGHGHGSRSRVRSRPERAEWGGGRLGSF
eukprot:3341857-Rhodomonas_salina.1